MNQQQFYARIDKLAKEGVAAVLASANYRVIKHEPSGGQTAVAEVLGIGRAAVCKWEAVPLEHVKKLCKEYNLQPQQVRPDLFQMGALLKELVE